jgi:catabolite regulation protein CreA
MKKTNRFVPILASTFLVLAAASISVAETLATIKTTGVIFKDTLEVLAFDDPDISGATCFVTLPKRTLSLEDQSDTSISCRKVGKLTGNISSREKIFRNRKSLFF